MAPAMRGVTMRDKWTRWLAPLIMGGLVLATAATAYAGPNAYGQVFAGQAKCLSCHGQVDGRYQVGSFLDSAHAKQIVDVQAETSALVPPATSTAWPSPAAPGGISFGPDDVWLRFGVGPTYEYISRYTNNGPHTLSTGIGISTVFGAPADDYLMFNNATFDALANSWTIKNPVKVGTFFQDCAACHMLGVTRPGASTYTLGNGATMTHSTETSYAGVGIQCENCHGTGSTDNKHPNWSNSSGVGIVSLRQALRSQTCGQCHGSISAPERVFSGYYNFFSANGFTPDRALSDFGTIAGAQYVRTTLASPTVTIPVTDTKFYPSGHNKSMSSGTYNEWRLSAHAHSLRYPDGTLFGGPGSQFWIGTDCLPCHSGEGFLRSLGYGQWPEPNEIGVTPSKVASDSLNIECGVCHTVHAKTGEPLGLRLPQAEICSGCHSAGVAPGAEVAPGGMSGGSNKEMLAGYGLIGVPQAGEQMKNATCPDCHMPVTSGTTPSHVFTPMLPGNAATWGVQPGGDSCTPCHKTRSRDELQARIDAWQADIAAAVTTANAAITSASTRTGATSTAGALLIGSAKTDRDFVVNDASGGVHNHAYAKAGLVEAAYLANAVGSTFPAFDVTAFSTRTGTSVAFGRLSFGDGSTAAGEHVVIEARPGGSTTWAAVNTGLTNDAGEFAVAVSPTGTTSYRARWTPKDAATYVYSTIGTVVFDSKTTIAASATTLRYGGTVKLTGKVTPSHAGRQVRIMYRVGTGGWRALKTVTLSSTSSYSYSLRPSSRGYWYFSALFAGDASHAGSASATVRTRVY
jgi:predicted CXXCH cytochrome family protein